MRPALDRGSVVFVEVAYCRGIMWLYTDGLDGAMVSKQCEKLAIVSGLPARGASSCSSQNSKYRWTALQCAAKVFGVHANVSYYSLFIVLRFSFVRVSIVIQLINPCEDQSITLCV
jgi:hypothetical protein